MGLQYEAIIEVTKARVALGQDFSSGFDDPDVSPPGLYILGQVARSPS